MSDLVRRIAHYTVHIEERGLIIDSGTIVDASLDFFKRFGDSFVKFSRVPRSGETIIQIKEVEANEVPAPPVIKVIEIPKNNTAVMGPKKAKGVSSEVSGVTSDVLKSMGQSKE